MSGNGRSAVGSLQPIAPIAATATMISASCKLVIGFGFRMNRPVERTTISHFFPAHSRDESPLFRAPSQFDLDRIFRIHQSISRWGRTPPLSPNTGRGLTWRSANQSASSCGLKNANPAVNAGRKSDSSADGKSDRSARGRASVRRDLLPRLP
jgi:hypothetical protein